MRADHVKAVNEAPSLRHAIEALRRFFSVTDEEQICAVILAANPHWLPRVRGLAETEPNHGIRTRVRNVLAVLDAHDDEGIPVTQATITAWADDTFGLPVSNASIAARANREMAELIYALAIHDKNLKAGREIADVVIVLFRLAEKLGVDLLQEVAKKMAENRGRQWAKDGNGHGQHIDVGALAGIARTGRVSCASPRPVSWDEVFDTHAGHGFSGLDVHTVAEKVKARGFRFMLFNGRVLATAGPLMKDGELNAVCRMDEVPGEAPPGRR